IRSSMTRSWLAWAVYLACSWTWCIGMFLPVLLVRDYGIWGWLIFAIPNMLGAAAMGWVTKSAASSILMVDAHRKACRIFSVVTISFQIYFMLEIASQLLPTSFIVQQLIAMTALFLVGAIMSGFLHRRELAYICFAIS